LLRDLSVVLIRSFFAAGYSAAELAVFLGTIIERERVGFDDTDVNDDGVVQPVSENAKTGVHLMRDDE
jgi:hypothetical protein